ncbi:MAG: TetR/AcrR family transcriptional regulator, partial [Oscillospiraceae bacterium]
MPPKAKYTREEIAEIAADLVAARGIEALNVRSLASALGTSTRPIFTAFKNVEELNRAVNAEAMKRFEQYADKITRSVPPFKSVGIQMITFASEQPELFRLLFMGARSGGSRSSSMFSRGAGSLDEMFDRLGTTKDACLEYIRRDYGLDERESELLFKSLWLYTFGICVLIANGVCSFEESAVSDML